MKESSYKIVFYSCLIALTSQLSVTMFTEDFRISAGAVCLAVIVYQLPELAILPTAALSGAGVVALRYIALQITGAAAQTTVQIFPEFFFYILYGLLLWGIMKKVPDCRNRMSLVLPVVAGIDYLSNFTELMVRMSLESLRTVHQSGILLVALIRGTVVLGILLTIRTYRRLVLENEEKERYRQLLLTVTKLNDEVFWMHKNADTIENTMHTAYRLYETMPSDSEQAEAALEVARNIHEIKKEYYLIMKGISDAVGHEELHDSMRMGKILKLLEESVPEWEKLYGRRVRLIQNLEEEFRTKEQYAMLSILRNLYVNAIESFAEQPEAETVEIRFSCRRKGATYEITVTDNGPGIDPEYKDLIFRPGFSTKFNEETGEISRGLGLSMVHSLVCERLHGSIHAVSSEKGTCFELSLPAERVFYEDISTG